MKRTLFVLAAVVALGLSACSSDDISDITITEAEGIVPGSWRVTYYYDNSNGESNDFDGYEFTFGTDGTVTAVSGGSTYNGFWNVQSSDDDPQYDKEIEITISGSNAMDELDGKWLIVELTESVMKLKDDTPSEEIHFEKL